MSIENGKILKALFEHDIELSSRLLELLAQEKSFLENNSIEELTSVASQKETIVAQIDTLARQTKQLFNALGLTFNKAGIESFIASSDSSQQPTLRQLWAELETILVDVQTQNTVNGAIIAASQHEVRQLLTILKGGHQRIQEQTYGPGGKLDSGGTSNPSGHIEV